MSKELELIRLLINGANEYEKETGDKNPTVYLSRNNLLVIEKSLHRLESIDNANPSGALEELKRIDWNITYLLSDCDINEEVSMNFNSIRDNKSCEVIKQALLKAQEQEKENEILKAFIADCEKGDVEVLWSKEDKSE